MNEDIKFSLDYFGGVEIVYITVGVLVTTQLVKPLLLRYGGSVAVRLFASVFGALVGAVRLPPLDHGALIGWGIGGLSAFAWFVVMVRLEVGSWKASGVVITERMRAMK